MESLEERNRRRRQCVVVVDLVSSSPHKLTVAIAVQPGSILFYISSFYIDFQIQKPTTLAQNLKRLCTFQSQKHETTRKPSNPRCSLLELSRPFPIATTQTYTCTHYLPRGAVLQDEEDLIQEMCCVKVYERENSCMK
ncbi:hypothetical protein OIU78_016192 [Salix suchowensis]|nr:hypothetical protein OIU78_016192 [Salix suchowensis]